MDPRTIIPQALIEQANTLQSLTNTPTSVKGVEMDANGDVMYRLIFGVYESDRPLLEAQIANIMSAAISHFTRGLSSLYATLKPINVTSFEYEYKQRRQNADHSAVGAKDITRGY